MDEGEIEQHATDELTVTQAWALYSSHFLSMWTSRTYEYAAILFIQHTFPGDLLPSSINGIAETVCVLVSSAALGKWVDQSPTRLQPLVQSILYNRITLVLCCALWYVTFSTVSSDLQKVLFVIILLLGMVEKASRMSNTLSVERDWIPTLASMPTSSQAAAQSSYTLTHLNTVIRRIDIACKFASPLAITAIMAIVQPWLAATLVGLVSAICCLLELWCARMVWRSNRKLRSPKPGVPATSVDYRSSASSMVRLSGWLHRTYSSFITQLDGVQYYFSTEVWIPSLGTAVLHASVLAWSGTLITWMLNCGFTYAEITVAKGVGSAFEFGSTFVFSWAVVFLTKNGGNYTSRGTYQMVNAKVGRENDDESDGGDISDGEEAEQGIPHSPRQSEHWESLNAIVVTAKWSILGLVVCLFPTLITLFVLDKTVDKSNSVSVRQGSTSPTLDPMKVSPISSVAFLTFLSFSFLGRWTYDLSITQLTQIAIPAARRSEFGGTEMALVSVVSLGHWIAAAIWHKQSDFKWLAVGSVIAVAGAALGYIFWVRGRWQKPSTQI